ncbi:MAG: AAA family ATPase [Desulfobacterales bacterium]
MASPRYSPTGSISETLRGIVERVTYHNPHNGWSILRVSPFDAPHQQETVLVHQTKVFAGATMEFEGAWSMHPKFGRQFKANRALEHKPATLAALEKYLGSGLIKGVGPKTARKIVGHFGKDTLDIFEARMERLTEIPGIAAKKLAMIREAWQAHRAIREVMMFLQSHGISTLFAVRIYKAYGDRAIAYVNEDPYRLAHDIYGIGFFSADKVALSVGLSPESPQRIKAAIRHILAAGREQGHCYLTAEQIGDQTAALLNLDIADTLSAILDQMAAEGLLRVATRRLDSGVREPCYYAKSLFYDERYTARKIAQLNRPLAVDRERIRRWVRLYCQSRRITLSEEQNAAVNAIAGQGLAILTGGPGCGKTTTTRVVVELLAAMGRKILLAAPTGRAAQRMLEVIGREAKTIHRLLGWRLGRFKHNEDSPLSGDVLIVDECSMLDISLTAALLKAVPDPCQMLLIGDADQLPAVGAGNVLKDLIASGVVPCFRLTRIFRQAQQSLIVRYAHQVNQGTLPAIDSPFKRPELWRQAVDCLFVDADEATQEQLRFITRVKGHPEFAALAEEENPYEFRVHETVRPYESELSIPEKFQHVDLAALLRAETQTAELKALLKKVHAWSALHYGLSALEVIRKLYLEWIPKYCPSETEIQILSPMTRGSLGTLNLNSMIQSAANPGGDGKAEITVGERILRTGDRVIHRRNNYELGVFNGDIGTISGIDHQGPTCTVTFFPEGREVRYQRDDIAELDLAYAITIHKSQGSEFEVVILPILTQHYKMLFRNLIYTGLTRARKLAVLAGTRRALAMAVRNQDTSQRQTALKELLQ